MDEHYRATGKTRRQEARDSATMLGCALWTLLMFVTVAVCVLVARGD